MRAQAKSNYEEEVVEDLGLIFKESLFEPDEDPSTFMNQLIALSDSHSEEEHYKPFTEKEKQSFEKDLVGWDLELDKLSKEKKAFNKRIDGEMKPIKDEKQRITDNLQSGAVWTKEVLYNIFDENTGMVAQYDSLGNLQRTKQMKRGRGLQKTIPLTSNLQD